MFRYIVFAVTSKLLRRWNLRRRRHLSDVEICNIIGIQATSKYQGRQISRASPFQERREFKDVRIAIDVDNAVISEFSAWYLTHLVFVTTFNYQLNQYRNNQRPNI